VRFDRKQWVVKPYAAFPAWLCPACEHPSLETTTKDWVKKETRASREARGHDDWEPEWIEELATGFLICRNCAEVVVGVVSVSNRETSDEQYGEHVVSEFQPIVFSPAIPMIAVPAAASDAVRAALQRAFANYWNDPSSSGNCIRTALEEMLDQFHIPRGHNDKTRHKRTRLTLHHRLEEFTKKHPQLGAPLMALKWLGNAGTHDVLEHKDVLDALDLLDHCFDEIYRARSTTIMRAAKAINRRKGPVKVRTS
jgi:hypothetical protein